MINFKLKTPCKHCPFRTDIPGYLTKERAREIADTLENGGNFPCHKTLKYDDDAEDDVEATETENTQMCAGAMIFLEKAHKGRDGGPGCHLNNLARFAGRFGSLNPDDFNIDAPVFATKKAFIAAQKR